MSGSHEDAITSKTTGNIRHYLKNRVGGHCQHHKASLTTKPPLQRKRPVGMAEKLKLLEGRIHRRTVHCQTLSCWERKKEVPGRGNTVKVRGCPPTGPLTRKCTFLQKRGALEIRKARTEEKTGRQNLRITTKPLAGTWTKEIYRPSVFKECAKKQKSPRGRDGVGKKTKAGPRRGLKPETVPGQRPELGGGAALPRKKDI